MRLPEHRSGTYRRGTRSDSAGLNEQIFQALDSVLHSQVEIIFKGCVLAMHVGGPEPSK